jgi:flagellar basal body-associated protein FliL
MAEAQQAEAPAAGKKTLVGRMAGKVGKSPYTALAVIVVLAILVIGLYVYYHGLLRVGPYAAVSAFRKGGPAKAAPAKEKAADEAAETGDPETERLIAAINSKV